MKKIALGLSGGVDSAVCAYLLKQKKDVELVAVYIECWNEPGCRAEKDKQDALKIALQLDIPFKTLDFKKAYKQKVIEYFFSEYKAGRTPNPDVLCNNVIKFGLFYDWALKHNFDAIATGHYSKIISQQDNDYLAIPKDKAKDQTYFLHQIKKEQLKHIIFPLADLSKKQVREIAKKQNLHVAGKKDSVGICFVGDVNVYQMLQEKLGENHGPVVDTDNNVIGTHKGLWFYTIGQRSGFTINQTKLVKQADGSVITKQNIPPFYVIDKNIKENKLIVGFGKETLKNIFKINNLHWINNEPLKTRKLLVRIRHTGKLLPCKLDKNLVKLASAERGIASGQFAVFYTPFKDTHLCLGGGTIK